MTCFCRSLAKHSWNLPTALVVFTATSALILFLFSFSLEPQSRPLSTSSSSPASPVEVNCQEKDNWPDLELFLTLPPNDKGERLYNQVFLPSLALFWPKNHTKLLIVTDREVGKKAINFAAKVEKAALDLTNVKARSVFSLLKFPISGWHKSQWLKFWADNFTSSKFVGFVDRDTLFVTRVTRNDLFVGEKPIVRPIFGKPKASNVEYWRRCPQQTLRYTGYKEPFNCMSYFPIVVKTSHLSHIRKVIHHRVNPNITFDMIFQQIANRNSYSEFNIMCAILWNDFRDEYHWIINESEMGWNGKVIGQVESMNDAGIDRATMVFPQPHLAIHSGSTKHPPIVDVLQKGACFSMSEREKSVNITEICSKYPDRQNSVNDLEFTFETDNFSERPKAYEAHLQRIAENDKCPHSWRTQILNSLLVDSENK